MGGDQRRGDAVNETLVQQIATEPLSEIHLLESGHQREETHYVLGGLLGVVDDMGEESQGVEGHCRGVLQHGFGQGEQHVVDGRGVQQVGGE